MDGGAMELGADRAEEEEEVNEPYDSHRLGYNPQVQNGAYDPQLETVRMESRRKIRGRFEHIFQKYGKDFEGVGDEIDMATGVIVVNNGHLQNIKHEVDAGNGDALALSRTFQDEDDDEDDDEDGDSNSGSEAEAGRNGPIDNTSDSSENAELDFSWQGGTAASVTSPEVDDGVPAAIAPPRVEEGRSKAMDTTSDASSRENTSDDVFGGLKDSMIALRDKHQSGQSLTPDAIQALGMSIANQLASFITSGKESKKRKRPSARNRTPSAEPSRGRRRTRSHAAPDPVAPTPARSPGSKSLWAPLEQPNGRKGPRRRKADAEDATEEAEGGDDSLVDSLVLQSIMHQSALEPDELQGPTTVRSCSNCKTTETLTWRRGPKAVDLCNNCGMYYYRYGLMRPLHRSPPPKRKSPTPEEVDPTRKPAPYSANTSRPLDGVNLFGMHFTVREDAQLIKLKEIDRLSWDQIAMEHPGRTPFALQCRYSKMLCGKPCEARDILSSRGYKFYVDAKGQTVARQPGVFTEEEDDLLLKLREEDHLDWDAVTLELPGRTAEDVAERFDEIAREYLGEQSEVDKPKAKRKRQSKAKSRPEPAHESERNASERFKTRYTPAEDDTILRLREDDKMAWQDIAKQMPGRTLASVQRRYSRDIGPYGRSRSSTPRGSPAPGEGPPRLRKYTQEEDDKLMRLCVEAEDLNWDRFAQQFPDRSATSLQNRYYYKIRQDDESPRASRESSVGSSSRSREGLSLPAVDLEAHLDEAQAESSSLEDSFTPAEDDLIIKLRELECFPWDQIAAEMPGRDVSSISCRYYQYLLPRKVPEVREANAGLDPALQTNALHDGPAVAETLTANMATDERGAGLHSRAETTKKKRKSDVADQPRAKAARRADAPMLRKALQKNLNRRSDPKLSSSAGKQDCSMMPEDAIEDELVDDGDPLGRSRAQQLLPSAFHQDAESHGSSSRKLRPNSGPKSAYPEAPLRGADAPYPSGPTPLDSGLYVTPSKYQAQSHPYFLANAASPEMQLFSEPSDTAAKSKPPAGPSEDEMANEHVKRSSRKRRRAPKPAQTVSVPQRHMVIGDTDDDQVNSEEENDDDTAGEYFTSRKKKKGPTRAQQPFRGRGPRPAPKHGKSAALNAADVGSARSDSDEETEEEDIEMPDLGTDDDQTSSESEPEDEDDDELRCKPKERSPLFDPRAVIEAAKRKKEDPRTKPTPAAKAGDGNTMDDVNSEFDISSIPLEQRERPDISWTQLNFMALRSRAPEPMYTRDIYAYLEEKFPFFRICKGHWRDSIRGNLSTRREFVKCGEDKSALWALADPTQETITLAKGGRRGRCPDGVDRKPKEPKVAKKLGRPSNASKGLPLKRLYKRNYIPAAERRRLAALEAEKNTDAGVIAAPAEGVTTANDSASAIALDTALDAVAERPQASVAVGPADAMDATAFANSSAEQEAEASPENEGNAANQATRASTIGDSEVDEHWEFSSFPRELPQATPEIKEETSAPERTLEPFAAPATTTSAASRDAECHDGVQPDDSVALGPLEATTPSVSTDIGPSMRSSSPAVADLHTGPPHKYGQATPGTAGTSRSTLFRQLRHGSSAAKASPALAQVFGKKGSRAGTPSSLRRTVQTPVRETEGSEDELA